eukprot:gene8212-8404_t
MLYHEKQVAALCGVHCINTLLQGPFFSELDLAQIGHELDKLEQQMLGDVEGMEGANVDDSGMFSIQVLTKALQVWGLQAIPTDNKELRDAAFDPQQENAFICNLQEHWFTIRQTDDGWWNFNSLYPAPEQLSDFYLTAYLDSLKQQGYTIFVVRGTLPPPASAAAAELGGPGRWWDPDEARAAHKSAQESRQLGRAKNAMEAALARAAAGGGAITLRGSAKRSAASQAQDDEDEDLAAAIAASMQDQPTATAGPSSAALGLPPRGSYAAVAKKANSHGAGASPPQYAGMVAGARLSRRFDSSGAVAGMQAYVLQQLEARGEAHQQQRVVLSMQFPTKVLDMEDLQIDAAGVKDRSMLSVQLA